MILVLGAGLSGISASYHISHEACLILEKNAHPFGHIHAEVRDGYTWDRGPHVSFTKNEYVRNLFAQSVDGDYDEYTVKVANYFKGNWISHPAQSFLHQVPEPLRSECLRSFLESRNQHASAPIPGNYDEWLTRAFGEVFARTFPAEYTKKYWTRAPGEMGIDWIGGRIFSPNVDEVVAGSKGPPLTSPHYITQVRYPRHGGFQSFARSMRKGARIKYGAEVCRIDLEEKKVWTAAGECYPYTKLVNTLPLPVFVGLCIQTGKAAREAALALSCTQLLLVNIAAPHPTQRQENWIYVYDSDKYATRINCTEKLTAANAPAGSTGVQVEVYFSRHRPLVESPETIGAKVLDEIVEMKLIDPARLRENSGIITSVSYCPWANVIFDHQTKSAVDCILASLESQGLQREDDDLNPLTNWDNKLHQAPKIGDVALAGRFGQWKYYWTDDCVLRGSVLGRGMRSVGNV
jgi:protoporphyrinogen oxidase